jgi:hypothetical protein
MINLENNEKFKELEKNYIILCNFTNFSLDLAFGYFDYLIKMREKIPIKVISRGKLKNHPKDYYKYYTSKRIPKRVIKNKKTKNTSTTSGKYNFRTIKVSYKTIHERQRNEC